ncbi:MAG: SpoIIE family protein phosphatase [Kineosporiaceae bacterium]|nr:SpoIIE family protein phosphatase [Kineosporiaceae bacterium]
MSSNVAIAIGLLVGGAAYLVMAAYVWRQRRAPAAYALFVSLIAILVWSMAYAIEMTTRSAQFAAIWATVKYAGVVTVPPSLLAFAVEYTGRGRHLTVRTLALLAVEPLIVVGLLAVPSTHHLLRFYDQDTIDKTPWPYAESGVLFLPHTVYSYVVLVSALALLVWRLARLAQPYRRPAVAVIAASVIALGGNAMFAFGLVWIDPAPFLFVVLMVVLVWGFFRMGLLDLVPIARSAVMQQLTDAVLVLDAYNRVIDCNPAATGLLGLPRPELTGRYVTALLPELVDAVDAHRPGVYQQHEVSTVPERLGRPGHGQVHLAVQLSSLTDRTGHEAGRLLVLRDDTQRTETERRLRELLESETRLATVLQTGLRPASLPRVPGIHLAARSLPAGTGSHVSGDFYDVHQALGGDWAFVLGDVAGKGVHAAVVTSMARYTARTLSAQGWGPKQVIEQLNQALLVDAEPERFCTVVYGRIGELDQEAAQDLAQDFPLDLPKDPPGGVRLTVALGGHPAPLVRRADGRIEAIGSAGTALGILPVVDIEEVCVDLGPGEVMVAYTDGVTEARREGVEFGEERLAWTLASAAVGLRGHTGPAAAALAADAVADRIVDAVTDFAQNRDDIAVLVLVVD